MKPSKLIWSVLLAFTVLTGCRKSVQPSAAMAPTVKPGEQVTINYAAYAAAVPRRWDVVALEPPSSSNLVVIKRVIALPGETILLTTNGIVLNGTNLNLPSPLSNGASFPLNKLLLAGAGGVTFPYTIPAKQYFVVGDNWANSFDIRQDGAVPLTNILGKVLNK